jgi:hypothetical protein
VTRTRDHLRGRRSNQLNYAPQANGQLKTLELVPGSLVGSDLRICIDSGRMTGKPEGTTPEEAKSFELLSQACVLKVEQTPRIFPLRNQY